MANAPTRFTRVISAIDADVALVALIAACLTATALAAIIPHGVTSALTLFACVASVYILAQRGFSDDEMWGAGAASAAVCALAFVASLPGAHNVAPTVIVVALVAAGVLLAPVGRIVVGVGGALVWALMIADGWHTYLAVPLSFLALGAGVLVGSALRRMSSRVAPSDPLLRRRAPAPDQIPTASSSGIASAGRAVEQNIARTLELLRAALRGDTCVVMMIDANTDTARVRVGETSSDPLQTRPVGERTGALGLARKGGGQPIQLDLVHHDEVRLPWLVHHREPRHVLIVPLLDEGLALGYLAIDRLGDAPPFDRVDAIAVDAGARQIISALHTERLLLEAGHAQEHLGIMHEASGLLTEALTLSDVASSLRALFERITTIDTLVITMLNEERTHQRVVHAEGTGVADLADQTFPTNGSSLANLALLRRHVLPYSGRLERDDIPVFGTNGTLPGIRSLAVQPLMFAGECIGTLTVGVEREDAIHTRARQQIELICSHAAAAVANAVAYNQAVTMATIDGMTGLTNHRTFKERATEALARAERAGRPVSLILTDIDHFKRVNDTYGHAIGDDVIVDVAQILRETLRKSDIGARYGGEEFAILLEDTTPADAIRLAERIRERVRELTFSTPRGSLGVTVSLGVASFPADAQAVLPLIEAADQALYGAKNGGRDQVVHFPDMNTNAA